MANVNDVTLATLKTTAISADNVLINGKSLDEYIAEKSTGTKVSVEPITTEGTLIAKISCDSKIVDVYSPLSVTKDEDYVEINESIGIDGEGIWLEKPVQSTEFSLSDGYINTKEVRGDVIKAQNIGPYDIVTLEQKESTISSDGRSICKELITRSAGSIISKETYVYDLPEKNGTLATDENCTAFEVFATSADIEPGTKSDTLAPTTWTLWNATTEYKEGVIVKKDENTVYVCITKSTNIEPGISENWQNYWKKIETEFSVWNNSTQYYKYELIKTDDGTVYQALSDNKSVQPNVTVGWEDKWQVKTINYTSPIKDGYLTYSYGVPACMTEELIIVTDSSKNCK